VTVADIVAIEGLDDAKRAIEALTKDMRIKVVRGALREAARPIVRQARINAPVLTGLIRKRIGTFTSKIRRRQLGEVGVFIKPRISNQARRLKLNNQDPYYYRWVEAGYHAVGSRRIKGGRETRARNLKASGARFIPGKIFMGRAFDSKKGEALSIFQSAIKKRIDLANRRK
jgi:HK97 gp10 family phage protein